MAQSRPRASYPKIIDRPELKTPWRYLLEGSFTLAFWALWIYWISPILTVLLWIMGVRIFYSELFSQEGLLELFSILKQAGLVLVLIAGTLLGWSYYNYMQFLHRGERRRTYVPYCQDEDVAEFFRIDPNLLREAKKHSRVEIHLGEKGINIHLGP